MNVIKKAVVSMVCASLIFTSRIYITPSFAAESEKAISTSTMTISPVKKGNAYVPKGTILKIALAKELSSKKARVGDSVALKLVENLIINDVVVVPAGAEVKGVVTKSRKAGGLGRGGKLEFSVVSVKTLNGVEIPLDYTKYQHGAGDAGAAVVFAAVSVVGGLFMKGKNVVYNEGLQFDVEVTADTDLNVKLSELAEAMDESRPHGVIVKLKS